MKASTFTEAQKAFILKQGEQDTPVAEICFTRSIWTRLKNRVFPAKKISKRA